MRDWAVEYILHVLETKDWSPNRLASEAGLAASTIARPLRDKNWSYNISRRTLMKIRTASGIDPGMFSPKGFSEDSSIFSDNYPKTTARHVLENLDQNSQDTKELAVNQIKITIVGNLAKIEATVDRDGIAKLKLKLDTIATIIDD